MKKVLIIGAQVLSLCVFGIFTLLHNMTSSHSYADMHEMHHGKSGNQSQNHTKGHMHNEVNMPGLQGKDTTPQEVSDLRTIFQQHPIIERTVSNLPNGITTFTGSVYTEV